MLTSSSAPWPNIGLALFRGLGFKVVYGAFHRDIYIYTYIYIYIYACVWYVVVCTGILGCLGFRVRAPGFRVGASLVRRHHARHWRQQPCIYDAIDILNDDVDGKTCQIHPGQLR